MLGFATVRNVGAGANTRSTRSTAASARACGGLESQVPDSGLLGKLVGHGKL